MFPDQAPSRLKVALRTGTTGQLRRRLAEASRGELGDTPSQAAERLLELVGMLSAHDRLTRGHSERVRAYTQMIGEEMKGLAAMFVMMNAARLGVGIQGLAQAEVSYQNAVTYALDRRQGYRGPLRRVEASELLAEQERVAVENRLPGSEGAEEERAWPAPFEAEGASSRATNSISALILIL